MSKGNILFIGINFFPEPTGIGKYSGEMVAWLAESEIKVEVITGFPYYPNWQLANKFNWYKTDLVFESKVKVHRCPLYVPKKPTGIKRIFQELTFLMSSLPKVIYLSILLKPKYILTIAPPFHLGLLGLLARKISGGKLLYHIQDLQIEAASSLNLIKHKKIIDSLLSIEKYILKKSDFISSIHPKMIEEVNKKTSSTIHLLPNWSDLKVMYPIMDKNKLRIQFNLPLDKKIFMYSGSIGEKQGLEMLINIAKQFTHDEDFLFIIAGNGPYYDLLKNVIHKENLTNIVIRNLVPTKELNNWLNLADFHLIFQRNETNNYLFPSKIVSILSVGGICVAFVPELNEVGQLLTQNEIGYVISEVDPINIKMKLIEISQKNANRLKSKSREFAMLNFNKTKILSDWIGNRIFDN